MHVPHAYAPVVGGTELMTQRLSEVLTEQGHTVRVVTTDVASVHGLFEFGAPRVGPRYEVVGGVPVVRAPYGGWSYRHGNVLGSIPWTRARVKLQGTMMKRARSQLKAVVAEEVATFRPDVVVALPHDLPNVTAVVELRRSASFPMVAIPLTHDGPFEKITPLAQALKHAGAVVAVTPSEREVLMDVYGVPEDRIVVAAIGVDPPTTVGAGTRPPRVLYLGRRARSKRVEDLIEAMKLVWQLREDAELVLVGPHGDASAEIDAAISSLPRAWKQQVTSLGAVVGEPKVQLLASARCLVLPSQTESFGIVLVEAMASETPVVAPDIRVFRDIVTHGEDGLLVDRGSVEAMAAAILRLLQDDEYARALGAAGRRKVFAQYTWERVAPKYLTAYEMAIERQGVVPA